MHIYPSLMVVAKKDLKKEIDLLKNHCAGFHLDVMDNSFVPNITWNAQELNRIIKMAQSVWIHLMIEDPVAFYDQLFLPDESLISFHIEVDIDIFEFIKTIKEKKQRVSIAIRPKTPISRALPFLHVVDQVLLMSVEPGQSGQPFLESSFDRLAELVEYRQQHNLQFKIGCDGGIDTSNIATLVAQGVDDCAIASAIFQSKNSVAALQELQKLADKKKGAKESLLK